MATTFDRPTLAGQTQVLHRPSAAAGRLRGFLRRFARNKAAVASAVILIVFVVISLESITHRIAPYEPTKILTGPKFTSPNRDHPFGTDHLGRDVFSRTVYGGRLTIGASFIGVLIAASVGVVAGLLAGYQAGWVDAVIMRLVDILLAFPGILLTLAVIAVLGTGLKEIQVAIGISLIPPFVRLVRGAVMSAKHDEYVIAAQTIGCRPLRLMARHILPNVMTSTLVLFTTAIGWAIIIATSLSFLGLGTPPPNAEWGADMKAALTYLQYAWWVAFPGFAITITIIAVNLLGDGLQDALDPHGRRGV